MSDPSNFVTNPPSTVVKVINTSRDDMNGQLGICISYNDDRARYLVHMVSTQTTTALKPENLQRASTIEQYRAQYHQIRNDPRIRQQVMQYYNQAKERLPIDPKQAAGIAIVVFIGIVYLVGFTRTMTVMSLLLLLGVVAAPDLVGGQNVNIKSVANNFPRRCRETLEQTVPAARGRVSNRVAFGIVMVMVLWVSRSLLPAKRRPTPASVGQELPVQVKHKPVLSDEDIYRLGYDDAKAGEPFGASLNTKVPRHVVQDDLEDMLDYNPPPPAGKPKFGIGLAMSAFFIFRTLKDLGTDAGGGFDPQLMIANFRTMEPWKMGVMAFSVYSVIRSFV